MNNKTSLFIINGQLPNGEEVTHTMEANNFDVVVGAFERTYPGVTCINCDYVRYGVGYAAATAWPIEEEGKRYEVLYMCDAKGDLLATFLTYEAAQAMVRDMAEDMHEEQVADLVIREVFEDIACDACGTEDGDMCRCDFGDGDRGDFDVYEDAAAAIIGALNKRMPENDEDYIPF